MSMAPIYGRLARSAAWLLILVVLTNLSSTGADASHSHSQVRRSLRQEESREQGSKNPKEFFIKPAGVALASSGFFLLSCIMICPCFYPKKKEEVENSTKGKNLSNISTPRFDEGSSSARKPKTPHHAVFGSLQPQSSPRRSLGSPLRNPATPRIPLSPSRFSPSPQLSRTNSVHLTFDQISKATQNFSAALKIGEGGFGTVYRAVLPDGQIVAVKRARKEHHLALRTEFSNEVDLLSKIEHMCLVRILGFLDTGNEKIIITEFVPNGTLRDHLDASNGRVLSFKERIEIAIDVAHGLTYLHLFAEKTIIHRDVKSSNILLTDHLRAKVADFGFAKVGNAESEQSHISTKVKGTFGYLDPEYLRTNQLTPKSDVFSFGVLLVEIFTGRRPVERSRPPEERLTVKWAFKKHSEGRVREIMDPLLREEVNENVLTQLFTLAFRCASSTRGGRPAMNEVGQMLWEIRKDYTKGPQISEV